MHPIWASLNCLLPLAHALATNPAASPYATRLQKPIPAQAAPSPDPFGTPFESEWKWLNWDPNNVTDQEDGATIRLAFADLLTLVSNAVPAAEGNTTSYVRWLGTDLGACPGQGQGPLGVYDRIAYEDVDGDGTWKASMTVSGAVLDREDFRGQCNLPTTAAYMDYETGRFHICDVTFEKPLLEDFDCGEGYSYVTRALDNIGATILHELTHWERVGDEALCRSVEDNGGSDPYQCAVELADDQKIVNAENYAFLAEETWYQNMCGVVFTDPPPQDRVFAHEGLR